MENASQNTGKPYVRKIPIFWWTRRWVDLRFVLRELTSVCVAVYCLIFLFFVRSILLGPEAYAAFMARMQSPLMIVVHVLLLGGLLYHSITWFNLAPKAMVIKIGTMRIPDLLIAAANYAGWIVISVVLFWLMLN